MCNSSFPVQLIDQLVEFDFFYFLLYSLLCLFYIPVTIAATYNTHVLVGCNAHRLKVNVWLKLVPIWGSSMHQRSSLFLKKYLKQTDAFKVAVNQLTSWLRAHQHAVFGKRQHYLTGYLCHSLQRWWSYRNTPLSYFDVWMFEANGNNDKSGGEKKNCPSLPSSTEDVTLPTAHESHSTDENRMSVSVKATTRLNLKLLMNMKLHFFNLYTSRNV